MIKIKWIKEAIIAALIIATTINTVQIIRLNNDMSNLHTKIESLERDISDLKSKTDDIGYAVENQDYEAENKQTSTVLGTFKVTVYTPQSDGGKWGYKTATGAKSEHLTTCAVDKNVIPLGTTIEVNGLKLNAVDTGSAVKGNVIDIFYDRSEKEANKWINKFGTKHEVEVKQ